MKLNCTKTNGNSTKSGNPTARDLTNKVAIIPDCPTSSPHTQKFTNLRPYSSPCRIYSRSVFQNMFRPSSTPAFANPVLSFSAVKRILRQRITEKGDALRKAFQLLDSSCSLTVSRAELRRVVNTFLLPLTREQFHKVLAQIPLTSSGAVPYLEFLSRFGGVDLNINVIKGDRGEKRNCSRTLKELEIQIGEKIFRNVETVIKALELIDVNKTGLVHAHELRRVLETFCVKMKDEEYRKFAQYYSIDEDTAVDYNVFLKNLSMNNDLNLRYTMGNQEVSWENQQVKNSKREHLPNSDSSGAFWEEPSLDDIERTFCQELSKSYERVEKALSAGDPSKSGCISLNYLKIVFDTFVYRLPRRIFIQLMKRFGLKTTSKVNWKQFLTSLYNPPWLDVNSAIHMTKQPSTNSTNRHHKENIITKLFRPEDHHTLLKKVLPTVNTAQKLDRQITGEELRHIINCMVVKISDSEFKELMQTLDPRGTGLVSVRALTELLQEDPQTGNLAPCTDTEAPLHPAQDSVEETFHDAITSNLVAFYNMLQSCDPKDTGLIGQNNFKKIMHVFCPLLTMEQLSKLCNEFQDVASGGILYKNLLASIGVSGLSPVFPVITPKDQPSSEHFQKEEQWLTPAERTVPAEDEDTVTKNTTTDEVMEKLRNGVQQQDPAFRKRFLGFSRELPGKMKVHDIRKVLEGNGMPVSDDQRAPLPANVGCKEGRSDLDVATGLEGTGRKGPGGTPRRTPVLPLSSWDSGLVTAEECLKLFPQRLREFFPDPYAAFFKIDTDQNGIINMRDLHRLLQHLLLSLKDEEFERFLGLLGLRLSMTLNFREFRNLFEKRPLRTDDAPQRLIRSKPKVTDSELACEQAHQYLVTKAKTRWTDLSKNFIETDNEGNGILRRRDIKNALYGFDIPLTPQEFEKLWTRYDTEGRGHVIYQEFLQKLGVNYSEDVHQPKSEDYFNFMGHFTKPQQIQEEIKELQRGAEEAVPAREKLKDHFQGISEGLSKLEKAEQGPVSVRAVQGVLRECGCPLTEQELTQLLDSWGISWQNNSINYHDFLRAVENSEPSRPQPKGKDDGVPSSFAALGPEEVLKNIQKVVAASSPALAEAFSALDKEDTGFVKASDFGHVLKDFCYELTDNQYHCFLRKLRIHLTPYINWKYFLQNFNRFLEKTAAEWAEKMPKGPPPRSPMETAARDTLAQLHKAVTCRYHAIAHEFENFDAAKTNTVSRDEFRAVCNRHVQILTDKQFDRLWNEMPVDAQGRLKYLHFLSRFLSEEVAAPLDTGDSAKAQKGASVPEVTEGNRSAVQSPTRDPKTGTKPRSHPSTPAGTAAAPGTPLLQNCEPLENTLRKKIQSCWRQLLKECKQRDIRKQGEITASEFLALVEKFNLDVNEKELQQLVMKYDLKGNGRFAYCNFIQSCVLLLKAKETSVMQRMKIQNAHKMEEAGPETSSFYSALLRIQPQIVHCWRPMRRAFKAYDERGTGLIGVADFRQVLRQYSINLSEEEFFHILQYYDKMLSSKISYNDFLRAFLQ